MYIHTHTLSGGLSVPRGGPLTHSPPHAASRSLFPPNTQTTLVQHTAKTRALVRVRREHGRQTAAPAASQAQTGACEAPLRPSRRRDTAERGSEGFCAKHTTKHGVHRQYPKTPNTSPLSLFYLWAIHQGLQLWLTKQSLCERGEARQTSNVGKRTFWRGLREGCVGGGGNSSDSDSGGSDSSAGLVLTSLAQSAAMSLASADARGAARLNTGTSGTSALHLVHSEINAVTSALRKHARNAASSSFLGSAASSYAASASVASGPISGGSSAASLLKSAVVSASAVAHTAHTGAGYAPSGQHTQSQPQPEQDEGYQDADAYGAAGRGNASAASTDGPGSSRPQRPPRYAYADGRRDDSLAGLLNGFTILRAQLRESASTC